ncbi:MULTISPECIES: hypothetical protein [unclassified Spirosoma]|uniref:hypothetical protein n=1 Tax=unclassified Spirosoma TaxID=2621999 RepID=UPI00096479ED|nr:MULTISPECIES: hypothetical protein [unclassified Spirosoma]MBN8824565.1 hypothetical protein [Spirosoma sp.]OJW70928.1 MAG: hypothetical protein BGO59_32410 [Spirosoma sp. 48-14]
MQPLIDIANQVHALEKKVQKEGHSGSGYLRHIQRIRQSLAELGTTFHSPEGERYTETRTDVEASVAGESMGNLTITQVIKPIVSQHGQIVQAGIVIVERV